MLTSKLYALCPSLGSWCMPCHFFEPTSPCLQHVFCWWPFNFSVFIDFCWSFFPLAVFLIWIGSALPCAPLSLSVLYPEHGSGCLAPPPALNCKLPGKRQRRRRPCPTSCLRASEEEGVNESLAPFLEHRQCSIIF